MAPSTPPSYDPNFPPNLNIAPLLPQSFEPTGLSAEDEWDQTIGIERYGIAGRVWDASYPLLPYVTRPGPSTRYDFEPACSLFVSYLNPSSSLQPGSNIRHINDKGRCKAKQLTILELGSGQSLASLHLATQLPNTAQIILTDLPEVVALCEKNVAQKLGHVASEEKAEVLVRGLAWGDEDSGVALGKELEVMGRELSHVLLCDLIYFPNLYPLLLKTLLQVTSSPFTKTTTNSVEETFGPELIISYKTRTLALEESFFEAFGLYFRLEPVLSRLSQRQRSGDAQSVDAGEWDLHGREDDTHLYLARRWKTEERWEVPGVEKIMSPEGAKGVKRGAGGFGLVEGLFGGLEWD